jgi:hypothetical protein
VGRPGGNLACICIKINTYVDGPWECIVVVIQLSVDNVFNRLRRTYSHERHMYSCAATIFNLPSEEGNTSAWLKSPSVMLSQY